MTDEFAVVGVVAVISLLGRLSFFGQIQDATRPEASGRQQLACHVHATWALVPD